MSLPGNSYQLHSYPPACPPESPSSEPVLVSDPSSLPPRLDPPYPNRAYFHVDIGDHEISLWFTNLPTLHIRAIRPLVSYYWWPRRALEMAEKATDSTVFHLSVRGGKAWSSYDSYRAKRDLVRLQLEILRVLHSQGWMVRPATPYTLQQPGWINRLTNPRAGEKIVHSGSHPASSKSLTLELRLPDSHLFPLTRTSDTSDPCYWLMLSMHYQGELWFVTSLPRGLKQKIVEQLCRSTAVFREKSSCYRILLQEPFEVGLLVVLDTLADFKFTTFASMKSWPPVIVLTCPQNTTEDTAERQRV